MIDIFNRLRDLTPDNASMEDWPEDFSHENGKYVCACVHCGASFIGHKRRVTCRRCALAPSKEDAAITALKRIRTESHWTTVHQIIDEVVGRPQVSK